MYEINISEIVLKYFWNISELFLKYFWLLGIFASFWLKFCYFPRFFCFSGQNLEKYRTKYVLRENSFFSDFFFRKFLGICREWCVWTLPRLVPQISEKHLNKSWISRKKCNSSRFWLGKARKATKGSILFSFFWLKFCCFPRFSCFSSQNLEKNTVFLNISIFSFFHFFFIFSIHVFKSKKIRITLLRVIPTMA